MVDTSAQASAPRIDQYEELKSREGTDHSEFCPNRWIRQLKTLAGSTQGIDVDTYVEMLYETTNLFKKMGSALSMAFSGKQIMVIMNSRHYNESRDPQSK